jgi:PPOX class probable F420-dependent enzyme
MTLNDLQNATYIGLETFRKNGTGVKTPIWQTPENGHLYAWTEAKSWKVKRIRNNSRVRVCKSDARGNPQSDWIDAQARILDTPEEDQVQRKRMSAKYSWQFWIFLVLAKIRRAQYVVIKIEPANV